MMLAIGTIVATITLALAERRNRNWIYPLRAQMGFLLMHAIIGWCPPLPIWRRFGVRTAKEIALEREALMELLETVPSETFGAIPNDAG